MAHVDPHVGLLGGRAPRGCSAVRVTAGGVRVALNGERTLPAMRLSCAARGQLDVPTIRTTFCPQRRRSLFNGVCHRCSTACVITSFHPSSTFGAYLNDPPFPRRMAASSALSRISDRHPGTSYSASDSTCDNGRRGMRAPGSHFGHARFPLACVGRADGRIGWFLDTCPVGGPTVTGSERPLGPARSVGVPGPVEGTTFSTHQ